MMFMKTCVIHYRKKRPKAIPGYPLFNRGQPSTPSIISERLSFDSRKKIGGDMIMSHRLEMVSGGWCRPLLPSSVIRAASVPSGKVAFTVYLPTKGSGTSFAPATLPPSVILLFCSSQPEHSSISTESMIISKGLQGGVGVTRPKGTRECCSRGKVIFNGAATSTSNYQMPKYFVHGKV